MMQGESSQVIGSDPRKTTVRQSMMFMVLLLYIPWGMRMVSWVGVLMKMARFYQSNSIRQAHT